MTDTTIPDATVLPEDRGTKANGNAPRDTVHAAQVGTLLNVQGSQSYYDPRVGDSVLTYNSADHTATLKAGTAYIRHTDGSQTYDSVADSVSPWDAPLWFVVEIPTDLQGLSLDGNENTDLWLGVDLTAADGDAAFVRHGADLLAPDSPVLGLGDIAPDGTATPRAPTSPIGLYESVQSERFLTGDSLGGSADVALFIDDDEAVAVTPNGVLARSAAHGAVFQQVFDSLAPETTVEIAPGEYNTSDTDPITLDASAGNPENATISAHGASINSTLYVQRPGIDISHLTVDGAPGVGFRWRRAQGNHCVGLVAKNCGSDGYLLGGEADANLAWGTWESCLAVHNTGVGWNLDGTYTDCFVNMCAFVEPVARDNDTGFRLDGVANYNGFFNAHSENVQTSPNIHINANENTFIGGHHAPGFGQEDVFSIVIGPSASKTVLLGGRYPHGIDDSQASENGWYGLIATPNMISRWPDEYTDERARDTVGSALSGSGMTTVTSNDEENTITVNSTGHQTRIYSTGDQNVSTTGSDVKVGFAQPDIDDRDQFDGVNGQVIIADQGIYQIDFNLRYSGFSTDESHIAKIYVNGTAEASISDSIIGGVANPSSGADTILSLAEGDVIEAYVRLSEGTTILGDVKNSALTVTRVG